MVRGPLLDAQSDIMSLRHMRAEISAIADEIKQSLELLRRHL
jgi:hypothetical protein